MGLTYDDLDTAITALKDLPLQYGVRSTSPASAYVVTPERVRDGVAAGTIDAKALLLAALGSAELRWAALQREGLGGLNDVEAHAAAAAAAMPPRIEGIERKYGDFAHRLRIDLTTPGRGGAVAISDLAGAPAARFDELVDRVTDTPERAAQAIVNVRRFDEVLVRVRVARMVAEKTRVPPGDVLTLHREEGNLAVFPSDGVLQAGLPPVGGIDEPDRREKTLIAQGHRPDITLLVWIADVAKAEHEALGVPLERYALATAFMTQPVGLDAVSGRFGVSADIVEAFAAFSAANWVAAGLADGGDPAARLDDARQRWHDLEELLVVRRTRGHSGAEPEAAIVVPGNEELFLAGILAEAIAFQLALRRADLYAGRPMPGPFADDLAAIRYNAQATPGLLRGLFASALLNATGARRRGPLGQAAAADGPLMALLAETRRAMASATPGKGAQEAAQAGTMGRVVFGADGVGRDVLDDRFATWLASGSNLRLLEEYVATRGAKAGQWTGYRGLRSYGWHYRVLREFYRRVLPS